MGAETIDEGFSVKRCFSWGSDWMLLDKVFDIC